jgi:amidase
VAVTDPFLPASALAALVREGAATSRDLVELYLERIDRHDDRLSALVCVDAEAARAEADARDADSGARGPLHGVPVTLKDAWATAGLRTASGSPDSAQVPETDAAVVARLRAAGAVVLGKTSVPTGVTGQETWSPLSGLTRNPWDGTRTSGASSGGAAAAVAAGLSPLDVGSDLGGSLRQPAHCCGIFSHAASHGLVPLRGHLPRVPVDVELDVDLLTAGPLARSADDLALALGVLAGQEGAPRRLWPASLPPPPAGLDGLRVAAWLDDPAAPVDPLVGTVLQPAAEALADAGARVDADGRPFPSLAEVVETTFSLWVAASSYSDDDATLRRLAEQAAAADPDDTWLPVLRARAASMSHRDWLRLDVRRQRLQARWDAFFDSYDVLLCPVIGVTAPEHDPDPSQVASMDHRLARTLTIAGQDRPYLDQVKWMTLVTASGLPATAVPVGLAADGLPVGMQVVGPYGADLTTIAVGGWIADLLGTPGRPPAFDAEP